MKTAKLLVFFAFLLLAGTKSFAQCSSVNTGVVDNATSVAWSFSFGGCGTASGSVGATNGTTVSLSTAACTSETFTVNGTTATAGGLPAFFTVGTITYSIVIDAYAAPCGNANAHITQVP
jgi:hypothetical protein